MAFIEEIRFDSNGLVPAIVQDVDSGAVLMMAYMNREAVERTAETGESHFYSRSRKKLWHKGETSGNVQSVQEMRVDCDGDTILLKVVQKTAACHKGYKSCFYRRLDDTLSWKNTEQRLFNPDEVYGKS